MKIYLAEDEHRSALLLKSFLVSYPLPESDIEILTEPLQIIEKITQQVPDLMLIDAVIKNCSCFDILNTLGKTNFPIIIVSASKEYAFKAFQYGVLAYVLKPAQKNEIFAAIDRCQLPFSHSKHPVSW